MIITSIERLKKAIENTLANLTRPCVTSLNLTLNDIANIDDEIIKLIEDEYNISFINVKNIHNHVFIKILKDSKE